jgi:hypothetical protein
MDHVEHLDDLKHFRAKAKSWEVNIGQLFKCNEKQQQQQQRLLQSRSHSNRTEFYETISDEQQGK